MNYIKKTKKAILWINIFNQPLASLYVLLAVILRKDLHISAFQIALLTTLKPVVSILSFYWSSWVKNHPVNLRFNLILAGIGLRIPFLLFPFISNVWFYIFSSALYMLLYRTINPIWIEVLKRNLSKQNRDRYYSIGSSISFGVSIPLAIIFGKILGISWLRWQWIFFGSALIGLVGLFFQILLPIQNSECMVNNRTNVSWKSFLILPLINSFRLMKERKDFARFQWIFMLGGVGLMLLQSIYPIYIVDILHLSYMDTTIAVLICNGLGFCFSTTYWARALNRYPIYFVISLVCGLLALHMISMLCAISFPFAFYLAHLIYGVANAGSHLSWNLSGAIFARSENSIQFSSVNIVMVGVRGLIAPALGSYLCMKFGTPYVFCLGMILCVIGTIYAHSLVERKKTFRIQ